MKTHARTLLRTTTTTRLRTADCRRVLAAIGVLAAFAAPGVLRAEVTDKVDLNFTLAADGALTLENANGSARIVATPSADGAVHVHAVKHGETDADLKSTQIDIKSEPKTLRIQTHYGVGRTDHNSHAGVDYTISVPPGIRLEDVRLTNGDLALESLTLSGARISATNGGVSAQRLTSAGPLSFHNVNGNLDISLLGLPAKGSVDVSDVNGNVQLAFPSGANAAVRAETTNGEIRTNTGLKPDEESSTGQKLAGRLGTGETPIHLATTNGNIRFNQAASR